MSPAREAPAPIAESIIVVRRMVEDANNCRLLLRDEEIRALARLIQFCEQVRVA